MLVCLFSIFEIYNVTAGKALRRPDQKQETGLKSNFIHSKCASYKAFFLQSTRPKIIL